MGAPTASEAEAYLYRHIPISSAMGVRVRECDERGVRLWAPLAPNINHRATVFGGSASAVAILAAWTGLHFALRAAGISARLVIQRNSVDYLVPITGDFEARQPVLPAELWEKFGRTLRRHGWARGELNATIFCDGLECATFRGEFVALPIDDPLAVPEPPDFVR